jgi:hypothetical protein
MVNTVQELHEDGALIVRGIKLGQTEVLNYLTLTDMKMKWSIFLKNEEMMYTEM